MTDPARHAPDPAWQRPLPPRAMPLASRPLPPRPAPDPTSIRAMPSPRAPRSPVEPEAGPVGMPADVATDVVHGLLPARPMPGPRPPRPMPEARAARSRPDPRPLRLLVGFAGLASASAITTALLPSVLPAAAAVDPGTADVAPQPSVVHVTRVVQLQPGQTAPPQASVVVQPTPTPRVHVVTTRQSGLP